jgi:hypothetical protein
MIQALIIAMLLSLGGFAEIRSKNTAPKNQASSGSQLAAPVNCARSHIIDIGCPAN